MLLVLTAALRVAYLAAGTPAPGGENPMVARVFALSRLGSFPGGANGSSPVASWQLAAYTILTRAFEREGTAIAAVREAMVVAAVVSAALLWILARRLGSPRSAAASAVTLLAVSPLAIGLQDRILAENVAIPWLLGAFVLLAGSSRRPALAHDLPAAALLLIAVLTSPVTLVLTPVAAWLMVRGREPRRVVLISITFEFGLGLAFGPAAGLLRPGLSGLGQPGFGAWWGLDPLFAVCGAVAIAAGWRVARLRPWALGAFLLVCALFWPGAPRAGVLTMLVPFVALLVVGVARAGIEARARPSHRRLRGHHSVPALVAAYLVIASAAASWATGYAALRVGGQSPDPLTRAGEWLRDNASGSQVLTDDAGWAQLAVNGWPTGALVLPSACVPRCPAAGWVVSTAGMPARITAQLGAAEAVAVFGTGQDRVEIARIPAMAGNSLPTASEQDTRGRAGAILAASPRITASADAAALLREGRADARLIATLAALAATEPVHLVALPGVDGEDAAGQPRRQAVLSGDVAAATRFFTGQRDVFHPESVSAVPGGVLVTYPPLSPSGLLTPFDTP